MTRSDIDIRETWALIEEALRAHAPQLVDTLAPPASDLQIAKVERSIGLQLPRDLETSLRCHNGQHDPTRLWSFTDGGMLLSTDGIAENWGIVESVHRDLLRQPPPVPGYSPPPWWKSTLIPITDDEGNMICVDTDPALGSERGQVIWHFRVDGLTGAIAESYGQWLTNIASRIRDGDLCIERESSYLRSE
jgi:cell wall assembly regulator SMI1